MATSRDHTSGGAGPHRGGVRSLRRRGTVVLAVLTAVGAGPAEADEALPRPSPRVRSQGPASPDRAGSRREVEGRSSADLDGTYLWLGPSGAAAHIEGSWFSSWGGGVQVLRVRERARLGVLGGWLSGVHYAGRDGGRVALEAVVGTRRILGPMMGLAFGPVVELGERHHPWAGVQASAWVFAGISPYLRVGTVANAGGYVELGVQLSLPARRW